MESIRRDARPSALAWRERAFKTKETTVKVAKLIRTLLLSVAVIGASPVVHAEDAYPDKPVVIVVGYVPGGPADTLARKVAQMLGQKWKQSVVVENRPGASATIANSYVAHARPDGYTLLLAANDYVTTKYVIKGLPYEVGKSHIPVGMIAKAPNIVVVDENSKIKTIPEFMNWVKSTKGLTYASTGLGSTSNLTAELFKKVDDVNIQHIPYKGVGQWVPDFLSGRVSMAFPSLPSVTSLIAAKKIRVIGVAQNERSPLLPDSPTFAESGLEGFDMATWWGLMAPKGTPADVVAKLNHDLNEVLGTDEARQAWKQLGVEYAPMTPEQFAQTITNDDKTISSLVSSLHLANN
jgi:tripartite-type tricarboxylate transporter receptor subunit TctC